MNNKCKKISNISIQELIDKYKNESERPEINYILDTTHFISRFKILTEGEVIESKRIILISDGIFFDDCEYTRDFKTDEIDMIRTIKLNGADYLVMVEYSIIRDNKVNMKINVYYRNEDIKEKLGEKYNYSTIYI